MNSVAFLPQGGFVFTKFFDPKAPQGFSSIMQRKATGSVFKWDQDTGVRPTPGTELAGANGIEVSKDDKSLYAAAWGTQELVRFTPIMKHGLARIPRYGARFGRKRDRPPLRIP
jgi:sugar lactone lactonase YvrE